MHSQLNVIVAQSRQYDLQRAAEGWNAAAPRPSRRWIRRMELTDGVRRRAVVRRVSASAPAR